MENNKSVDVVVIGATGFTGKRTVKELARLTKEKNVDVSWAIAGRSKDKLEHLVTEIRNTGFDVKTMPVMLCDVEDEESLRKTLQTAKVVINCTGVNIILSPKIVKVCIETGTHYVDISSEIFHILALFRDYHETAKEANVLLIPCCGYSSIPMETGLTYLEKNFKGTLHSVESYAEVFLPKAIPTETLLHNGTWTSLVHVLLTLKKSQALKKELFKNAIEPEYKGIVERSFFFRNDGQLWYPWPGVENDTVQMSQRHLFIENGKKPIHFKAYVTMERWFYFLLIPMMFLYYYLCYFKCFAKLLINYPRIFTFGYFSAKGPTYEMSQKIKYSFLLKGKGWKTGEEDGEPKETMSIKVSGKDPYDATAIGIIMSAITVIKERPNMPKGGVILPGAAFHNTDIVDRLANNGYTFTIL